MDLGERMEWTLQNKFAGNASAWATAAGLSRTTMERAASEAGECSAWDEQRSGAEVRAGLDVLAHGLAAHRPLAKLVRHGERHALAGELAP